MQEYTKLTTYILFMKQYNFQGRHWKPSALSELTVFSANLGSRTDSHQSLSFQSSTTQLPADPILYAVNKLPDHLVMQRFF